MGTSANDHDLAYVRQLGRLVREARTFLGWSQEQLAELARMSQGAVSRLERGDAANVPHLVVIRAQQALGRGLRALAEQTDLVVEHPFLAVPETLLGPEATLHVDAGLLRLVRLYWGLPVGEQARLVHMMRAAVGLGADAGHATSA